jgi:ubiquinone/menaquinone biosynthesis C-methylase UbiE/uncharacterized protein YbaR (Trm112 family)
MDKNLRLFIPYLRCPVSGKPVREVGLGELEKLNTSIALGKRFTQEGETIRRKLQEALISEDGRFVYPVTDGYLAEMLPEQAISAEDNVEELDSFPEEGKKKVKEFYDEYGWLKDDGENFNDTVTFEDLREVSQNYWSRCHLRLNKYLGSGGDYLLDVASGAIPNDEYLTYSKNFKLRVCMDFSVEALKGAAERLNGKGIFILGDMTRIPLADHCVDGVISMHTVYHVPQKEQTRAVAEAYRVIKPGKQAVIVYSWKESGLMKLMFGLYRPLLKVYQSLRNKKKTKVNPQEGRRLDLFVEQQNYDWFSKQIQKQYNARLTVYSAISRSFSQTFLRERWLGKQLSAIIYQLEEAFPSFLGRWGQYPVFILKKPSQN